MTARTLHERKVLDSLQSVRDNLPAFTETVVLAAGSNAYQDFGEGWTATLKAPTGYKGKVVGVAVYAIAETFACDTTAARVDVGNSGDSNIYYVGGDVADGAAAATPSHPAGTFQNFIPGGQDFLVTGVQCVDTSTAAGRALVALTIEWFQED